MTRIWHIGMWIFVNGLFLYKYSGRINGWLPVLGGIAMLAAISLGARIMAAATRRGREKLVGLLALSLLVAISVAAFHFVPTSSLRVDRFEMIQLFWDNTAAGISPYTPRIPGVSNVPSQFPLYFLFALPFHWIHEIGWIPVVSVLVMAGLIWKQPLGAKARGAALTMLLTSPALWWEIVCRSTIFGNAVLLLCCLLPLLRTRRTIPAIRSSILLGGGGGVWLRRPVPSPSSSPYPC